MLLVFGLLASSVNAECTGNELKLLDTRGSSVYAQYTPDKAIDGGIANNQRWLADPTDPFPWIVVEIDGLAKLSCIRVQNGYFSGTTSGTTTGAICHQNIDVWVGDSSADIDTVK